MKAEQTRAQLIARWIIGLTLTMIGAGAFWLTVSVSQYAVRSSNGTPVPLSMKLIGIFVGSLTLVLMFFGIRTMLRRSPIIQATSTQTSDVHRFFSVAGLVFAAIWAISDPLHLPVVLQWPVSFLWYGSVLYALAWVSIFTHEGAHALVAAMVGQSSVEICVGYGRELFRRKFGSCEFVARLHPFSGYAAVEEIRSWKRLEVATFAVAGPIATLLLGCGFLGLTRAFPQLIPSQIANLVTLSLFWSVIHSMLPGRADVAAGRIPSDGSLLLAAIFPAR